MKGRVAIEEIDAPSLAGNPLGDAIRRSVVVYLPPGYDTGRERYPTVYFLHGFTGSGLGWLNTSAFAPSVPERMDALIDAHEIPPAIGVFVDGWTALGGSQWIDSPAIGRYGAYLTRDVVSAIDAKLRTQPRAEARAVVGKSSGGYGALVTVCRTPGVFAHAASHSGDAYFEYCYWNDFPKAAAALLSAGGVEAWWNGFTRRSRETRMRGHDHPVLNTLAMAAAYSPDEHAPLRLVLPFEPETARVIPEVWARWLAHDPVRLIPRSAEALRQLKTVFVDCGTRDEFNLRWGARMVVSELQKAGLSPIHEEFEDGHSGINYRYDASLRAVVPRLI